MNSLLASVAAAVLYRAAEGLGRFGVWVVGPTGSGKSFAAKLAMNFFGSFPVSTGPFVSWTATPNFIQRTGYFFQDALYLVDDYKPEVVAPWQALRVRQNYADNTGRGRLRADATANVTRPIRGQLLCTGEDAPDHSASAAARCLLIRVPQANKDVARGERCVAACRDYSGVTADFIRHVLARGRRRAFRRTTAALQRRYYRRAAGRQNDLRGGTSPSWGRLSLRSPTTCRTSGPAGRRRYAPSCSRRCRRCATTC